MGNDVEFAMETLIYEMKQEGTEPGSYAHAWCCNITMAFYDEVKRYWILRLLPDKFLRTVASRAATNFMKLCFEVDVVS